MIDHTPGDWVAIREQGSSEAFKIYPSLGAEIASVYESPGCDVDRKEGEAEANAAILEAAPKMYRTIMDCINSINAFPKDKTLIIDIASVMKGVVSQIELRARKLSKPEA